MSMYLPNDDARPTGAEAGEFVDDRPEAEPADDDTSRDDVAHDDETTSR
jgi:hypothetical protein